MINNANHHVLPCNSRFPIECNMAQSNQSRVLCHMTNADGNSSHEVFPRVRQNTERTHEAEQAESKTNKANRGRTRDTHGLFTANSSLRYQHQYPGHEAHNVHQPSRIIPRSVKSGKQVPHHAVQNRWKPNFCLANKKQNIKRNVQGIWRTNSQQWSIRWICQNNMATEYQQFPPNMHHRNTAEKAISTFKDHFKAILTWVNTTFLNPKYLTTYKYGQHYFHPSTNELCSVAT